MRFLLIRKEDNKRFSAKNQEEYQKLLNFLFLNNCHGVYELYIRQKVWELGGDHSYIKFYKGYMKLQEKGRLHKKLNETLCNPPIDK